MTCTCQFVFKPNALLSVFELEQCPLHKSAPELLKASRRALDHMLFRGWAVQTDHELCEVYEQLKAAVEAAEGRI